MAKLLGPSFGTAGEGPGVLEGQAYTQGFPSLQQLLLAVTGSLEEKVLLLM